jgi:hypothetical protein
MALGYKFCVVNHDSYHRQWNTRASMTRGLGLPETSSNVHISFDPRTTEFDPIGTSNLTSSCLGSMHGDYGH